MPLANFWRDSEPVRRLSLWRLLGALRIAAVVGVTLSVSRLLPRVLDAGLSPAEVPWTSLAIDAATLCGWVLIAFIAWRWRRHREFPATWAVLAVVGLGWAAILVYHGPR